MLTPAYNLTATERVLPRMALDFTTGVLDSRVTVTRALNTATRVNSSGYVEAVNANLPRFDYVPSTLAARGLLIEESRANLFLQSEALTSPWTIDGGGSLNATPTAAPDNANTAKKLQENTANTYFRAYQEVTMTNGAVYTATVFAKPSGRNWLFLYFSGGTSSAYVNIATKTVGTTTGSPTITFSDYANGFTRVNMTFTNTSVGGQNVQAWLAQADNVRTYQGDGSSGMYLWGFQLEAGAFATSYIPTTTTSLTRNADNVGMTGTNFSSWYNASAGTIDLEFDLLATTAGGGAIIAMITAGAQNGYGFYKSTSSDAFSTVVGATFTSTGTVVTNTVQKTILGYDSTNIRSILNRESLVTIATASIGSPAALYLGRNWYAGDFMSGHMRKVSYWPQKLTDAELTANTY